MITLAFLAFAFTVYLFIKYIVRADRGYKEPRSALLGAVGYGVLAVFLAGTLNNFFIPSEVIDQIGSQEAGGVATSTLFWSAMGVGLIEESVKALPLALVLYKRRHFDELTDGVIYFGIVGMTFGVIEDIMYTLEFGGGVGIMRVLFSPYLHAGFSVIFGMFLIQKKLLNRSWLYAACGLLLAIIAHGLFDFSAFTEGPVSLLSLVAITIIVNSLLFVFFKRAQNQDEQAGRSAVGVNKYCRSCGHPNPRKFLYCEDCGQRT